MPLLEADDVSITFGGRRPTTALRGVSIAIDSAHPSITAIVGESGSGKTTLTRLLLGFLRPTSGSVRYDGVSLAQMNGTERRAFRREVQAIFQDPFEAYNPFYRVDRALMLPLQQFGLARSRAEAIEMIERALVGVGLRPAETLGRYPHQLSGGQRQRVMIARALLLKPTVILADEPVSMVDASLRATILESLFRLKQEFGISLIYVTHDLTTAYQIADTVVTLYAGTIVEVGKVEEIMTHPEHPYTQQLIDAIPLPDPDMPWGRLAPEPVSSATEPAPPAGPALECPYSDRCPKAMDRCRLETPPLYRTGRHRATACFLYDNDDPVAARDVIALAMTGNGPG
ncbi:MAG: ABC transporter ATP-binding protein [Proteobacteria bacterium]|nr:ABC transporter ATP-binding protein [Pseudomonadota bacterium]